MFEVSFPDLAGIFTFGETYADAIRMAHDALTQYLLACAELGIAPPEPSQADQVEIKENERLALIKG